MTKSKLALAAILAALIAATVATPLIIQAEMDANAHRFQMSELDRYGDEDGQGEHAMLEGRRISEISIYWDCSTMGNQACN